MINKRFPKYPDDADYTTNSPSYYDDLARKRKLIQLLAEKIWEYEETLDLTLDQISNRLETYIEDNNNVMNDRLEQWDLKLEKFPENVEMLLQDWLSDGTLDHIINETIFNTKADITYVDSELAKTLFNLQLSLGSIPYGEITPPEWFVPKFPSNFYRSNDGEIYHDFNFNSLKTGTEIYVDSVNGLDTNDGLEATPYKTLSKVFDVITASGSSNFIIKCKSVRFNKHMNIGTKTLNGKSVTIVPDNTENKVIITNHNDSGAWTDRDYNTWSQGELGYTSVFDLTYTDAYGVPIPLKNVATLTECRDKKHSWHTTGSTMYVHLHDDRQPDNNVIANSDAPIFNVTLLNNARLYLENVMILHGQKTQDMIINGDKTGATIQGTFINKNCVFAGGDLRIDRDFGTNAISFDNVKNVYSFDSIASYGSEDGFNYHYYDIPSNRTKECLAIEYNCISYGHGINSDTGTSNCSTNHNGGSSARFSGIYYESKGPIISDTQACHSLLYNCNSVDSLSHIETTRNAFRFSNANETGGKAYLENCNGGGKDTYSIYNGDTVDITLRAFRGAKFKEGQDFNVTV